MSDEFIPRAISRVRVALYGPSGVGKTLFRNMLLRKDSSPPEPSEKSVVEEILREYKRPTEYGVAVSVEKYKLTLVDVPGRPELKDERNRALSKIVGWIFMYDATDPKSPEKLLEMIKNELEPARKLKSAIAVMVVGTKKDLGVNEEALRKGEEVANHLAKHTTLLYGYTPPHITISCLDPKEVALSFICLEAINFELRPPEKLIEKIKAHKPEVVAPPKPPPPKPSEVPKVPSAPVEEKKVEVSTEAKMETIEIPEVPKPPEERPMEGIAEEIIQEEQVMEDLGGVGMPVEKLPEIPSPKEVLEEIEKPAKEIPPEVPAPPEKAIVVEKPAEIIEKPPERPPQPPPPKVEWITDPEDKMWSMARKMRDRIEWVDRCYIIRPEQNKVHVAHDGERGLPQDTKKTLDAVSRAVLVFGRILNPRAIIIVGEDKNMGIVCGRSIMVFETSRRDILPNIFSIFASLRQKEGAKISIQIPKKELKIKLADEQRLWKIARRIKLSVANIVNCYMVIKEDGSLSVAHDGDRFIARAQEELISDIIHGTEILDEVIRVKGIIIFGEESLAILKKKGYIIMKLEGTPPIEILQILSAAT